MKKQMLYNETNLNLKSSTMKISLLRAIGVVLLTLFILAIVSLCIFYIKTDTKNTLIGIAVICSCSILLNIKSSKRD